MNISLSGSLTELIPKIFGFSLNFIDDIFCLLLSHWGIHLTWLQFLGYGLIFSKMA